MGSFDKSIQFWSLKSTEELCLMALTIDAKFEGKLICAFKKDMENLTNFCRVKNSDFIVKLNQNKHSTRPDQLDAVWKLYITLEINE